MQITKLEESKVKEYRGCFINGLMDSKYIEKETYEKIKRYIINKED